LKAWIQEKLDNGLITRQIYKEHKKIWYHVWFLGKEKLVDMIFWLNKPFDIMKIKWGNGVKKHHINDHMNVHMWVLEHLTKKIFF
jgi:hypothetical protein